MTKQYIIIYLTHPQALHHPLLFGYLPTDGIAGPPPHLDRLSRTSLHALHTNGLRDAVLLARLQIPT